VDRPSYRPDDRVASRLQRPSGPEWGRPGPTYPRASVGVARDVAAGLQAKRWSIRRPMTRG
jgi:hypothetical protein